MIVGVRPHAAAGHEQRRPVGLIASHAVVPAWANPRRSELYRRIHGCCPLVASYATVAKYVKQEASSWAAPMMTTFEPSGLTASAPTYPPPAVRPAVLSASRCDPRRPTLALVGEAHGPGRARHPPGGVGRGARADREAVGYVRAFMVSMAARRWTGLGAPAAVGHGRARLHACGRCSPRPSDPARRPEVHGRRLRLLQGWACVPPDPDGAP